MGPILPRAPRAPHPRVDVVVNIRARELGRDGAMRRAIESSARSAGAAVHATSSLDDLEGVARTLASRGTDAVVLAGGDGSHTHGLSALSRAWPAGARLPPVALAPGGTMNTVARNLGMLPRSPASAARLIAAVCARSARATPRATLRVTDDRAEPRVGFIFGAALVARFFELYDRGPAGPAAAAAIVARVFAGSFTGSRTARRVLEPEPATVRVDGVDAGAGRWSLVLASVVPDLGLGLRATYRALERLDRFHVVASGLPPRQLAVQMPRVLGGKPLSGEPRVDTLASDLRVTFASGEGSYILDGDVGSSSVVTVTVGPRIDVLTCPPQPARSRQQRKPAS